MIQGAGIETGPNEKEDVVMDNGFGELPILRTNAYRSSLRKSLYSQVKG